MLQIFDLDGTVIDSSHRKLTRPDGTLDLDHWRENCTPEKIFRDKLLPLARVMRARIRAGDDVIICTARLMGKADYAFLRQHGIMPRLVLSRSHGDHSGDGEYKKEKLIKHLPLDKIVGAVMFDDAAEVRRVVRSVGVRAIDPEPINARLA